jgi:hypothetical protein
VYGFAAAQTAEDETWIDHAGRHGLVVLTKDERIARKAVERAAVLNSDTKVFCLVARGSSTSHLVEILKHHQHRIEQRCAKSTGAGFWKVCPDRVDRKF